ncbi:MAG: site-2 protease family protein [Candidatus Bathyarchaeia archaeon]
MSEPSPLERQTDSTIVAQFDQIQSLVTAEFDIEESLIEHGIPTFYVKLRSDSKQAFTRLVRNLANIGFTPVLRKRKERNIIKIAPKPKMKPSRPIINVILFLLTIITVFITGYFFSIELVSNVPQYTLDPWIGASSFTLALLGILGAHEMAHKFAANHHKMEATMPYFIPGPPPLFGFLFGIGTFGAVIVQKETAPNRDALFDIGASGPIAGFIVTIFVSALGLMVSPIKATEKPLPGGGLPISPLFVLLMEALVSIQPIHGRNYYYIFLHPVAFAGWIGMFVTLLNLLPTGMLDGGHTLRSIINDELARTVFTVFSILILLFTGQWIMLAFVLFLSMYRHPGPLDDVSKLSLSRKLVAASLIVIFALCLFIF